MPYYIETYVAFWSKSCYYALLLQRSILDEWQQYWTLPITLAQAGLGHQPLEKKLTLVTGKQCQQS